MDRTVITCIECNKPFSLTPEHVEWFKSKNLELPKRCKSCRIKRRSLKGMKKDV